MSARAHHALRALAVLVLLALAIWPRSRSRFHDPRSPRVALATHVAVTTAARRDGAELPRPRTLRAADDLAAADPAPRGAGNPVEQADGFR